MQEYKFSGPGGSRVVVASNESEARHLAMVQRWGPPSGMYGRRYEGRGLILLETKPARPAPK